MAAPKVQDLILAELPGTVHTISEKISYTDAAVARNLREMEALELVHIVSMKGGPRRRAPIWVKGPYPEGVIKPAAVQRRQNAAAAPAIDPRAREEETIQRARVNPASWFSVLG